jgi:hypothetical protein
MAILRTTWVGGQDAPLPYKVGIWKRSDAGVWSYEYLPVESLGFFDDIYAYSGDYIAAVGRDLSNTRGRLWIYDGSWVGHTMPLPGGATNADPTSVYVRAVDDIILVVKVTGGATDGFNIYHWDGGTFTHILHLSPWCYGQGPFNGLDGDNGTPGSDFIMAVNSAWNEYTYYDGGDILNAANWHAGTLPGSIGAWGANFGLDVISPTEAYLAYGAWWTISWPCILKWSPGWGFYGSGSGWGNSPDQSVSNNIAYAVKKDPNTGLVWACGTTPNTSFGADALVAYTDGASWTRKFVHDNNPFSFDPPEDIDVLNDVVIAVGGRITAGYVWRSEDLGNSWETIGAGFDPPPFSGWYDCNNCALLEEGEPTQTTSITESKIIAEDVVKVTFETPVAAEDNLVDLDNWSITAVTPDSIESEIKNVLFDPTFDTVLFVYLEVSRMSLGAVYQVNVSNIRSEDGILLANSEGSSTLSSKFQSHLTKIDSILKSMSSMYGSELGSNIREVLSAIAIIDEEIGGETSET